MTHALTATGISVSFGGVTACDGIDLALGESEVVGLTGPNGSGKSTFLNAVNGLVEATGTLSVGDRPVPMGAPRAVRDAGVLRCYQTPQNLGALSCIENVLLSTADRSQTGLAATLFARAAMWRREHTRLDRARDALNRVGLGHLGTAPAAQLTYGQQRLLELARAVAGAPAVLMLDEPAAGLNEGETAVLADLLAGVRAEGVAIIVIDHKVDFLDRLSDRIVVLALGRVIADGPPNAIWKETAVVDAYLGTGDRREEDLSS